MGNSCPSGIPVEDIAKLGIPDFSNFPPWLLLWPVFWVDIFFIPFGLRHSWRQWVPFGMADPGRWLSAEFEIIDIVKHLPEPLTFEQFQQMQGYEVKAGTGLLAGLNSLADLNDWSKSMHKYVFETPSTSLALLTTPTAIGAILLLVCGIKFFKALAMPQFRAIGVHLAVKAHGEKWLTIKENEERIVKFAEYVFRLCYHSFSSLLGFYLFWNAPWLDKERGGTLNFFLGFPNDPVPPSMTLYYLVQAAYNVDAMISLLQLSFVIKVFPKDSSLPMKIVWSDTVRGDFNEMMAHHIVTNALVFWSSWLRQTRIGSMVFWMHDISDVPVDLSKLANFVKWKAGTVGFFITLCVTWFYTRLYVLPCFIWYSIYTQSHWCGETVPQFWPYFYAYKPMFLALLGILILLHFLWFSMFIKMAWLLITTGSAQDLSEHKKGETDPVVSNGHSVKGNKQKAQ